MRRLINGFTYIAVGLGIGALSAYFLIEQSGAEPVSDGSAWMKRELSAGSEDSYFIRAHFMLGGRLPPPPGQLIELSAETDDEGGRLSSKCLYRLAAQGPLPRWWSLSVTRPGAVAGSRQRTLNSDMMLRSAKGDTVIEVAETPQPGNWLRVPSSRFALLYTALPVSAQLSSKPPFAIRKVSCR